MAHTVTHTFVSPVTDNGNANEVGPDEWNAAHTVTLDASELLTSLKTVDGAGSGLDADLLDAQSSAYYLDRGNHTGTEPVASGGTSATTARAAQANLGGWYILASSAVQVSHTGTTGEVTLATITVPAGAMGANGRLRIYALFQYTGTANVKTPRFRWGGASMMASSSVAASLSGAFWRQIANRNSVSSQIAEWSSYTGSTAHTGQTVQTFAVDTSVEKDITITGQLTNAGDSIALESYVVELFYAA